MLYDKGKINLAVIIVQRVCIATGIHKKFNHMPGHIDYKSVLWTVWTSKKKDIPTTV